MACGTASANRWNTSCANAHLGLGRLVDVIRINGQTIGKDASADSDLAQPETRIGRGRHVAEAHATLADGIARRAFR